MRLRELKEEWQGDLRIDWKAFLLRPAPADPPRSLEDFKRYTRSWQAPAAEEPRAGFRVWAGDEGPPSHSMPPHRVAKAAQRLGAEAFERVHELLLQAYFRDSRDITADSVLAEIWRRADLPTDRFAEREDPAIERQIRVEFQEALGHGASGAPAVRLGAAFGVLMGAQPTAVYRQWLQRASRPPVPDRGRHPG